jgi:hypothetical protein
MNQRPSFHRHWLLLLPICLGLASCGNPQQDAAAAAAQSAEELASLERTKAQLEKEMKLLRDDFEKRHAEVLQKNEELIKSNDSLKSQFEKAQDEAATARRELEAYMARYKTSMRAKAKGLVLPRMETSDKAFEQVVVKELTPTELAFTHSGGVGRIDLAKLTPDLQKKLFYDAEEVKALAAAEAATAEAVKGLKQVAGVVVKDPSRPVNPLAVQNLTKRIVSREAEIQNAEKEAREVQKSAYGKTNIAQYRVKQLGLRVDQLKNDIAALRTLLDKEING